MGRSTDSNPKFSLNPISTYPNEHRNIFLSLSKLLSLPLSEWSVIFRFAVLFVIVAHMLLSKSTEAKDAKFERTEVTWIDKINIAPAPTATTG